MEVLLLMYIIMCLVCTQGDTGVCKCRFSCVWSFVFAEIKVGNWECVPNTQMKGKLVYGCLRFAHTWVTPSIAVDIILTGRALPQLHFVLGWLKTWEFRSHNESLNLATTWISVWTVCPDLISFRFFFFLVYDDFPLTYKYVLHKSQCCLWQWNIWRLLFFKLLLPFYQATEFWITETFKHFEMTPWKWGSFYICCPYWGCEKIPSCSEKEEELMKLESSL